MAAKQVFRIENGKLYFAVVGEADDPDWQAPGGKDVGDAKVAYYLTDGGDYSCQVQVGAITASPNTSTETLDATFCEPEETKTITGKTSFVLDVTALQDAHVKAGLSRFLYDHDTEKAYAYLGFDNENPPKAIGKVTVQAGTIGGPAKQNLTFSLSLPYDSKPQCDFGTTSLHEEVPSTGEIQGAERSSASPGDVFPADTDITASDTTNAAKLATETPPFVANPQTNWTTGQAINIGPYTFHWNGTAWTAGSHP